MKIANQIFGESLSDTQVALIENILEQRQPEEIKVLLVPDQVKPDHLNLLIVLKDQPFVLETILERLESLKITLLFNFYATIACARDGSGKLQEAKLILSSVTKANKGLQEKSEEKDNELPLKELVVCLEVLNNSDLISEQETTLANIINASMTALQQAVDEWQLILNVLKELYLNYAKLWEDNEKTERNETKQTFLEFLLWITEDHFTFCAYRSFIDGVPQPGILGIKDIAEDKALNLINNLSPNDSLIITKSSELSPIRRHRPFDVICLRDPSNPQKIHIFYGLFTSFALRKSARDIPILRNKLSKAAQIASLPRLSHQYKRFLKVFESIPRSVLFQLTEAQILEVILPFLDCDSNECLHFWGGGSLNPNLYFSLLYVKSSHYRPSLLAICARVLEKTTKGKVIFQSIEIIDLEYARIYYILDVQAQYLLSSDSYQTLKQDLYQSVLTWNDHFLYALRQKKHPRRRQLTEWTMDFGFSQGYQSCFSPEIAIEDLDLIFLLSNTQQVSFHFYRPADALADQLKVKAFNFLSPIPLSDLLPIFENLDLRVISETSFKIEFADHVYWIHDLDLRAMTANRLDDLQIQQRLTEALYMLWDHRIANDKLNCLIMRLGLNWRECELLRAYCYYMHQLLPAYSYFYIYDIVLQYLHLLQPWLAIFYAKFDPTFKADRLGQINHEFENFRRGIKLVRTADHDEVIRTFLNCLTITLRTNFFQKDPADNKKHKSYISFKCEHKDFFSEGVPLIETFVYNVVVQALHGRGGKVARGGIRWSDRREDFRMEILDLLRTQMIKNAIIIPTGAKGGFIIRDVENIHDPKERQALAIQGYNIMINGMLDLVDNIQNGQIVSALDTVCYDGADAYLVVAADKGTASYSDFANKVAVEREFWLGDAFASGGSCGYEHKKLAITSLGAWESAKNHFAILGKDPNKDPITVIGIGDMSGDVFGNGMLLSKSIKLIGAFNHSHIFIDPTPDPEASYQERLRLFKLPYSQWTDYNQQLISPGGGIFARTMRSIPLSPEIKQMFNINSDEITPEALIRQMLKSTVDMIWFGGIGTFVKSSQEDPLMLSDKLNANLRVNAEELKAKVIVEGANLAMTQMARIAFAHKGGLLNTDTVDNSGGVDCSDHEVNLKILLKFLLEREIITLDKRNQLLRDLTEEVVKLVLKDNFQQNRIISLAQFESKVNPDAYINLLETLGKANKINRSEWANEQIIRQKGLTRPELAVLLAHSKIYLKQMILNSALPNDARLIDYLTSYFPPLIQKEYPEAILAHVLRKEIIATGLVNEIINFIGLTFINDWNTKSRDIIKLLQGYLDMRPALNLTWIFETFNNLDPLIPLSAQYSFYRGIQELTIQAILRK